MLSDTGGARYDVAADGRFLMIQPVERGAARHHVDVVINWFDDLGAPPGCGQPLTITTAKQFTSSSERRVRRESLWTPLSLLWGQRQLLRFHRPPGSLTVSRWTTWLLTALLGGH